MPRCDILNYPWIPRVWVDKLTFYFHGHEMARPPAGRAFLSDVDPDTLERGDKFFVPQGFEEEEKRLT